MTPAVELRAAIVTLRPELLRRARGWMPASQAEDLVQDACVRALTFQAGYRAGTNVRAWLHHVLRNTFLTTMRRRRCERRGKLELSNAAAQMGGRLPPAMLGLSPPVAQALSELPETFRAAVVLIDLGERSYLEAAAELGIPQGTLMSRVYRGRRLLAARLADLGGRDAA